MTYTNRTSQDISVTYRIVSDDTGVFYADDTQLEAGNASNRYNLIEDGDFRYGKSFTNASDGTLGEVVSLAGSGAPQLDAHVLKVTGDYANERRLS